MTDYFVHESSYIDENAIIGMYSMVAAGAVVTKDVPDFALVAGVPAKRIGWVCKCGTTLNNFDSRGHTECKECRSKYVKNENGADQFVDLIMDL